MTSPLATSRPTAEKQPPHASDLATYATMLTLRRCQEKIGLLVAMGLIGEPPSSMTGREPVFVAVARAKALREPVVAPAEESVLLALALGQPPASLFTELLGGQRADITATGLSSAESAAEAIGSARDLAKTSSCVFLCLDSRNIEEDILSKKLNAAHAAHLPLVTVLSVPAEDKTHIAARVPHDVVDGLDAARVENCVLAAAAKARAGNGPVLVVVRAPTFQGHVAAASRPAGTRVSSREDNDPLVRLRARILEEGRSNEAALKSIEKTVRDSIAKAAAEGRRHAGLSV